MTLLERAELLLALLAECQKALPEGELKSRVQSYLADETARPGAVRAYNLPKR